MVRAVYSDQNVERMNCPNQGVSIMWNAHFLTTRISCGWSEDRFSSPLAVVPTMDSARLRNSSLVRSRQQVGNGERHTKRTMRRKSRSEAFCQIQQQFCQGCLSRHHCDSRQFSRASSTTIEKIRRVRVLIIVARSQSPETTDLSCHNEQFTDATLAA